MPFCKTVTLFMGPTEALALFCKVVNPCSKVNHPGVLSLELDKLLLTEKEEWGEKVKQLIEETYTKTLELDRLSGKKAITPRKIVYKDKASIMGTVISFRSRKTSWVELHVSKFSSQEPVICFFAQEVRKVNNLYSQFMMSSKKDFLVSPPENFRNIRVPLGELLDFLDKYR